MNYAVSLLESKLFELEDHLQTLEYLSNLERCDLEGKNQLRKQIADVKNAIEELKENK